jgi:hypothetical protein
MVKNFVSMYYIARQSIFTRLYRLYDHCYPNSYLSKMVNDD